MSLLRVDTEKCTRCGACAADCPFKILDMSDDGPVLAARNEEICIACGHCVAVCPVAALNHAAMAATACPDIEAPLTLDARRAEQFLRSRRSIRSYKKEEVEPALLDRLVRLACYAPTAKNSQPLHWLVISGVAEVRKLARGVGDWMRWLEKEQPKVFRAMYMDHVLEAEARGEDRILRGAPHLIVVHAPKDNRFAPVAAPTALAYLELAAPSLGLGTCWAGYFTTAAKVFAPLQEVLRLPEGHEVFGAVMVGYTATRYAKMPLRQEPRVTWRAAVNPE
jgi:nitroreductase/NAD-dependent dihydropyrimidine dehydrogenase PreA subunit